jgi:hypothetical protein
MDTHSSQCSWKASKNEFFGKIYQFEIPVVQVSVSCWTTWVLSKMLGTKTCFKVIQKVMCPDLVSANVNNLEMGGWMQWLQLFQWKSAHKLAC